MNIMNNSDKLFTIILRRNLIIILVIIFILIVFIGIITALFLRHHFQELNWNDVKDVSVIPVALIYSPEEAESLTGKYETYQYIFHQKEWEAWKTLSVDVSLRLNKEGNIEISKCSAFIPEMEEMIPPMFVTTYQYMSIDGDQMRVAMEGYLDYGSYKSGKQTVAFEVNFIPMLKELSPEGYD